MMPLKENRVRGFSCEISKEIQKVLSVKETHGKLYFIDTEDFLGQDGTGIPYILIKDHSESMNQQR